jgi:hypothetical protein
MLMWHIDADMEVDVVPPDLTWGMSEATWQGKKVHSFLGCHGTHFHSLHSRHRHLISQKK